MDKQTITGRKFFAFTLGAALIFTANIHSSAATTTVSPIKITKVPRHLPKPGISASLSHLQQLPHIGIVKSISPNKQYLAQVVLSKKKPVYYLSIVNLGSGGQFIVNEPLIAGEQYPYKKIRLFWKDSNTVVVKAKHHSGNKLLTIRFNLKTIKLSRLEEPIKAKPRVKKHNRLNPESLSHVRLKTLEQRMMLHKQIPLGVTYDVLSKNMPELSGLKTNPQKPDDSWATLYIDALGSKAEVKFTFKKHLLHNFFYAYPAIEDKYAKINYRKLQNYYSQFFGKYKEEYIEEEPGRSTFESQWKSDEGSVTVSRIISWGRAKVQWLVK